MIEIYYVSGSPYSWRVMLTAEVKGVPHQPHVLQLSKGEHRSPEYLKMNPRGREPLLRDGDFVVTESLAMMIYLDRLSEQNPLFGTDTRSTVRVFEGLSQVLFDCEKATLLLAEPTHDLVNHGRARRRHLLDVFDLVLGNAALPGRLRPGLRLLRSLGVRAMRGRTRAHGTGFRQRGSLDRQPNGCI